MKLKLQTYKGEKLIQIIYNIVSHFFGIYFLLVIISRFIEPDKLNLPIDFLSFLIITGLFTTIVFFSFHIYISNASRKEIWKIDGHIILNEKTISINKLNYSIEDIVKIEIQINGYERKVKSYRGNFYNNGAKNYLTIYTKEKIIKNYFFLDNMRQMDNLEKLIIIYGKYVSIIDKT